MKNTHEGVLLLVVKLQTKACNFTKSNTPPWVLFTFFKCTNATKSRKAPHVNNDDEFNKFCKISIDTLNSFAPIKKKFARTNQMPFITKEFSRKIMKRLRNSFLKKKTEETCKLYLKQQYVSLLQKTRKEYYQN